MDDVALETFTLPLEAARLEVRAIIADISCGYQKIALSAGVSFPMGGSSSPCAVCLLRIKIGGFAMM